MENLRKKESTEILEMKSLFSPTKNTVEGHSSRLVKDRISDLKDKIEIKEKTGEILDSSRAMKGICKNSVTPSKTKPENHGH
jgi:hypothetical protein